MRTASLIMLSGLFVQGANAADDIRLSTFPNSCWAVAAAVAVAIFGGLDHDIRFVFGNALLGCFGPGGTLDRSVGGIARHQLRHSAQIARRWDEFICGLPEACSTI
jgi:hypothetical protein